MLRIGFDVDDVLNNSMTTCLMLLNEQIGTQYTKEHFTEWNIYNCMPQEHADCLKELFTSNTIWKTMLPTFDAQCVISRLVQEGHQVYFISCCDPSTHVWKTDWLKKMYPFVNEDNHIYVGKGNKKLINLDILIDDNPEYLKGGLYYRVLLTQPWNRNAKESCYDKRINILSQVKEIIDSMEV